MIQTSEVVSNLRHLKYSEVRLDLVPIYPS